MRAARYVRVSTDEQAKSGYSIADQLRTLRHHAESNGYEVIEELKVDGYSGASIDRPGLMRVYKLAAEEAIDIVLATKRDRLFRNQLYRLQADRDLKDHGVRLVSLNDTGNKIGDASSTPTPSGTETSSYRSPVRESVRGHFRAW